MKLIDLLVQELPKRGGWPAGADFSTNYEDGSYLWFFGPDNYPLQTYPDISAKDLKEYGVVVTQDEYKNALAASRHPAWSGEGLPPAGTVCEVFHGNSWSECEILYCGKYHVVVKIGNFEGAYDVGVAKFRPLTKPVFDVAENSFEDLARPLIKWINDNANPHAVILIDATSAVLYSGERSINTEEFIRD